MTYQNERTENMVVETLDGLIKIEMVANGENEMNNLRSEMLDWFEDFVKREADCNRHVVTTYEPIYEPIPRREKPQKFSAIPPEVDVDSACQIMDKLNNLLSAYIVLKSMSSLCGEVVQIPIRHEEYENIITDTKMFLDHVIQRYMGGYPF